MPLRRPVAFALVAVLGALAACGGDDASGARPDGEPIDAPEAGPEARTEAARGEPGTRLPDVELLGFDGAAAISLADIDGPAVVNLWATWCAPCRREIPDFEAVYRERGDEVRFVGINVGEDEEPASEFLAEVGATYEQFRDDAGYVVTELRTTAMPVTLVIDADGVVRTRHLGPMDQDDLDAAIDDAV